MAPSVRRLPGAFPRKNSQVSVAAQRPPEAITQQAKAIGPTVTANSLQDTLEAQDVILAIPFSAIAGLAAMTNWSEKRSSIQPTRSTFRISPRRTWAASSRHASFKRP
ncbi:NAD(P)-binding domain-containing protein [Labrys wisconsinensis]|uniref:NAD(P)-binding domain-containing protein n=1 Tax=Labrys wisconsinensis TaxID=425677 RepID=UPI003521705E